MVLSVFPFRKKSLSPLTRQQKKNPQRVVLGVPLLFDFEDSLSSSFENVTSRCREGWVEKKSRASRTITSARLGHCRGASRPHLLQNASHHNKKNHIYFS